MFLIEMRATGDPIGYCGPRTLNPDENPELGYALDLPYWGHGLAFEAAERAVRFVQDRLGVSGMVALTSFDNKASQTILTKLGFKRNMNRDHVFYGEDSCFFEIHFTG